MKYKMLLIKNKIEQLSLIADELEVLGNNWGLSKETILNMNLVLEELISNIIYYSYRDDSEHDIKTDFSFDGQVIKIQIEDDGIEFNPLEVKMPDIDEPLESRQVGGLGIFFVRELTKSINYQRINNRNILSFEMIIT